MLFVQGTPRRLRHRRRDPRAAADAAARHAARSPRRRSLVQGVGAGRAEAGRGAGAILDVVHEWMSSAPESTPNSQLPTPKASSSRYESDRPRPSWQRLSLGVVERLPTAHCYSCSQCASRCFDPPSRRAQPPARTRNRLEIPDRFKWNLRRHLSRTGTTGKPPYHLLEKGIERYAALKGTLAQGPERLLEAFKLSEQLGQLAYRVWYFPSLRYDEDQRDNTVNARRQQVQLLFARWKQAESWFNPELLGIPLETVRGWMDVGRGAAAVPLRHRGSLPAAGTRARRGRRAADVAGQPAVVGAERGLLRALHRRRQVSDDHAVDRRRGGHLVRAVPGDSRDAARAVGSRPRVRGAAQHLSSRRSTPTPRSTTASASATGSRRAPAATRARSRRRSTATTSRPPWSRT